MIDDTICALSTAPVHSPIAIIRISGPDSASVMSSIFHAPAELKPRYALYGAISHHGTPIDDVVAIYFKSPQSYTGEDMFEIFCHGNPIIVQKIITALGGLGIRLAQPGEFTKRAFLNGKMDLTEAEAIHHIITAKSEWEIETALKQMHGSLKAIIQEIRSSVIGLKADIEAGIDFSDEAVVFITHENALKSAEAIYGLIRGLLEKCRTGEQLSHGIDVTITGKPNAGKSSILNLLLNQDRAIVSSIPGTTRDIIREPFQISGMSVNLNDTAGIGTAGDEIEQIGIGLSLQKIASSHFIIMVLDATSGFTDEDQRILEAIGDKKKIILINKIDIAGPGDTDRMKREITGKAVLFSAKTGEGFDGLKKALSGLIKNEFIEIENSFIADLRIINLLEQALQGTARVRDLIRNREPDEIIAFDLQCVLDSLSEITGEITPDDILDSIFGRFCIGK